MANEGSYEAASRRSDEIAADLEVHPEKYTMLTGDRPTGRLHLGHYFGTLKPRVLEFMHDLDEELWKLGIYAKTEHNEVAPAQHELAPIFATANIAVDHNQITMELMQKVARRHGMECLLHEKPFAGVNGSGKHNNWSISTDSARPCLSLAIRPTRTRSSCFSSRL